MGTSRKKSNPLGTWRKRRSSTADLVRFWSKSSVQMARKEELDFMKKFGICEDATNWGVCFAETGGAPVSTKWVDVNKGVGRECEHAVAGWWLGISTPKGEKEQADVFASTSPTEVSIAANHENEFRVRADGWERPKLMFIYVKKTHLNGNLGPDEVALVQLRGSLPGKCSRLKRRLCGMRQAASAWERDFVEKLAEIGLMGGKRSPVEFHDPKTGVRYVHGDDFTFLGFETELQLVKREMWRVILGDNAKDEQTLVILNLEGGLHRVRG